MPQASTTEKPKRTRTRQPTVKVTQEIERKLDRLGELTATRVQASGGIKLTPTHTQLVEALVDTALDNENGASA